MPHDTTNLFVGAHCTGLGAVLAQGPSIEDCLPVAIASRATSKIEQRYPQLDLEGIAVDFGLRRFCHYLIGGPQVNVITDHKPLVSIFQNKRLGSLYLDRIKLRHQDINFKLTWKKGATNPADFASRHPTPLSHLPKHIQQESEERNTASFVSSYTNHHTWNVNPLPHFENIHIKIKSYKTFLPIFYTMENLTLQVTVQLIQRFLMNYLRWRINYTRRTGGITNKSNRFSSRESSSRKSFGRKQFEASNSNTFLVSESGRSSKNKICIMQTIPTLYQQNNKRTPIYAKGTIKCMGHSRTRPFWSISNRETCSCSARRPYKIPSCKNRTQHKFI